MLVPARNPSFSSRSGDATAAVVVVVVADVIRANSALVCRMKLPGTYRQPQRFILAGTACDFSCDFGTA